MASKKATKESTKKAAKTATVNPPKEESVSSLPQGELKALIEEQWGNDGNVQVSTGLAITHPMILGTLDKLLRSPVTTGYAPSIPGDESEWAFVGINHVQFKIRRDIDVVLPVQVHKKLRIGIKKSSDVDRLDLDSKANKEKAEILNHV